MQGSPGAMSNAGPVRTVSGGIRKFAKSASVVFNQEFNAEGTLSNYPFHNTPTGSLSVHQGGPRTTTIHPLYGANTCTGGTFVHGGKLAYGVANALPVSVTVTLNVGTLDTQGFSGSMRILSVQDGAAVGSGTLTADYNLTQSGTIAGVLAGAGSLVQSGSGTTVLVADNEYARPTVIDGGTLLQQGVTQTMSYTVNGGGRLEIEALGQALPFTVIGAGGVMTVLGSTNSLTTEVGCGLLEVSGTGFSGGVLLDGEGELPLRSCVDLSFLSWQRDSTVGFTLGTGVEMITQDFLPADYGFGKNVFVFEVGSGVQAGESFTRVGFESLSGLTLADFAFTSVVERFAGEFALTENALSFTVSAVPAPPIATCVMAFASFLLKRCRNGYSRRARSLQT